MHESISILYVEDQPSIREYVKIILSVNEHWQITFASNGKEAFELYQKKDFNIVITDMMMPIMNGFELITEIQKIEPKQIIIMASGLEDKDDLIKAIDLKVNSFIPKPIDSNKLLTTINDAINLYIQKEELKRTRLLLEQYKHAIDESTILSKADLNGRITYANNAFCRHSQYEKEELIGKSHNIVRHPDTNKEIYKNLWETITAKKQWRGTIKNRAKDGSTYVVDALILPILDTEGNISEYIGVRHDITELEQYRDDLEGQLSTAVKEIVDTQKEVVFTMGAIGELRSKETGHHVKRVAEYSYLLARLVGLDEDEAQTLKQASPMHDIGKVAVPDAILNKPGKLTKEEFEVIKNHAELGYEMLKYSKRDLLKAAAIVAYEHHEKWDGTGYPNAKSGENIHIYGRITAIADVFDALGHDRCYKKAWPLEKIYEFFKDGRSKHFDPQLIDLFFENIDEFLDIRSRYNNIVEKEENLDSFSQIITAIEEV
jgi:PAS domain S-box-containing protein